MYIEELTPKVTLAFVAISPFPSSMASWAELQGRLEEIVG